MPAVVGAVKVNSISGSGIFHIGDVWRINANSTLKTFAGAGSFNTGDYLYVQNGYSMTSTNDSDFIDNVNFGNI
ncbi:spore germination protein [Pullulanibacillus sp. KACC 23026]|uniref:spore germination protein n=1 Tax=Pullulanibacillus sp. KACC 23026 TaxID=3028315 RepID=UPI0023B0A961|nr:spore germination protein [Pullulanibacillus sp. KACC 23026]WEG12331.1 spore germination protein [Pullulanibacillus sp. KACC 23026]